MILDRVHAGNPQGAAAYRDLLKAKAAQYGLDPAAVDAMKQPVLTREIPDSALTAPNARQTAITDLNKVGTAALTPGERAIADSRRVSSATLDDMGGRLEAKGPDSTVAQALEGKAGGEVLKRLIDDGVVSPQERAAFVNDGGELTPAGRDRISKLMVGRFFRDPAQLDTIAPSIRNKVERIAAPLARVEERGAWSLTEPVREALTILERAQKLGVKNVDDFLQQDSLFGEAKHSPETVALARAISRLSSKDLLAAVRQYSGDSAYAAKGANTLMGDAPTPESSFADAFGQPAKVAANALADAKTKARNALAPGGEKAN